eukprot:sb/3476474/
MGLGSARQVLTVRCHGEILPGTGLHGQPRPKPLAKPPRNKWTTDQMSHKSSALTNSRLVPPVQSDPDLVTPRFMTKKTLSLEDVTKSGSYLESISRSYPLNCSSFCHICLEPRYDL